MESTTRIILFLILYTLSVGQSNFTLMILLINQRYLESQKTCLIIRVRPERIKAATTENEVNKPAHKLLETHGFPQFIGTIDGMNIEIVKLNKQYWDYNNKTGCFSLNPECSSCVRL